MLVHLRFVCNISGHMPHTGCKKQHQNGKKYANQQPPFACWFIVHLRYRLSFSYRHFYFVCDCALYSSQIAYVATLFFALDTIFLFIFGIFSVGYPFSVTTSKKKFFFHLKNSRRQSVWSNRHISDTFYVLNCTWSR